MSKVDPLDPTVLGNTKTKTASNKKKKQIAPSKNWFFTHNHYGEKDIEIYRSNKLVKRYALNREVGEESGIPHIQGYLEFREKKRPLSIFPNDKVHWEKCRSVDACKIYCSKEETRVGATITNIAFERVDRRLESFVPMPWQQELHDYLINEDPDDRTVWIYHDPVGGNGKTLFMKWMADRYDDVYAVSTNRSADILTGVKNTHKIALLDIPRTFDMTI